VSRRAPPVLDRFWASIHDVPGDREPVYHAQQAASADSYHNHTFQAVSTVHMDFVAAVTSICERFSQPRNSSNICDAIGSRETVLGPLELVCMTEMYERNYVPSVHCLGLGSRKAKLPISKNFTNFRKHLLTMFFNSHFVGALTIFSKLANLSSRG